MVEISTQCSEGSPCYTQLFIDASNIGWGANWNALMVSGVWITTKKTLHINVLELEAIHRAMLHWLRKLMGLTVLVAPDNSTVIHQQAGWNTINTAVQTDVEATPHVSGQPNSALGTTHPWEIERPCRPPVMPCPDVSYRMVYTHLSSEH